MWDVGGGSSQSAEHAMGNRMSRIVVGCFSAERPHEKYAHGLHFSEPLDEGLGHSFCYVRPVLGALALSPNHEISSPPAPDLALAPADAAPEAAAADPQIGPLVADPDPDPELRSQRGKHTKSLTETSFKAISGASVSANTATPRSVASQEQFNSFSNVPIERAAAFESTASFSALPLQRIANSGPISGPLSGPLLQSGPLERGFMSGPIERGFMSGPLEPADRNTFSAPLAGLSHPSSSRRAKSSLRRFVRSMSLPMRKAIAKTTATLTRTIVIPVRHFVLGGDTPRDSSSFDSPIESATSGSDLDLKDDTNLQWAQGKAGEDRVHVVLSEEHGWLFVGIYDGFNGPDAPDFLMSNLYPAIYRELKGLLWNQKSAFELADGGQGHGDFISRLGHSDPPQGCGSVKEMSSDGREQLGGNGCDHLDWPSDGADSLENHGDGERLQGPHQELSRRESNCGVGLGVEQEGKLVEDRVDAEQEFSSIVETYPEPIGSGLADNTPGTHHSILNMKLQVLHNRRREQHRKYPQWR
jgi:hypothetical protein